jgi:hypothetical protein
MLWRMSVDSHPRGSTDGRFPTTGCPNDAPSGQGSSRSSPARCPIRPTAGAACCAASRAKPHFSGAMAPENSIHRLPHPLDEPTNKRRKGRKPPILGNRAFFDDGAKRRKPGGNWRKPRHEPPNRFLRKIQGGAERAERSETPRTHPARWSRQHYRSPATHTAAAGLRRSAWWKLPARTLAREPVRSSAVSPTGCSPNPDWRVTCGNCANCASRRLPAGPKQWTQLGGDQHFSYQCFFIQCFQELRTSRQPSSGWRQVSSHCHIFVIGQ